MSNFFSVIIPLYNKEKQIQRAINSVLNQTICDFQLIVVNDGSSDNSEQLVNQYSDPRLTMIKQKNAGVSAARNTGILNAEGKYIALLDADDEWMSDFLEKISLLINAFPQARVYSTAILVKTENREFPTRMMGFINHHSQGIIKNLFACLVRNQYMLSSSSICIERELFIQSGMFDTNLVTGEDIDMWIRLFLLSKIAFSTSVHGIYYKEINNSGTNHYLPEDVEKEIIKLISADFSKMVPAQFQSDYIRFIQIKLNRLIRHYAALGKKIKILQVYQTYSSNMSLKTKLNILLLFLLPNLFIKPAKQVYRLLKNSIK
jgi:glycosyltransferase involved in cell wall biosynthesis